MRHDASDEQLAFRDTARRFLERHAPISMTRMLADHPDGFDRDVWRAAAGVGWCSLLAPDRLGGGSFSGNALADLAIVAEEIGRGVAPGPLLPTNVVVDAIARAGSPTQQDLVLPGLIAGSATATWALAETNDVWGVDGLGEVTLVDDGQELVLDGRKRFVEIGASADHILVAAMAPTGPTQVLVPAGTPGVRVIPGYSIDLVRKFADVHFDAVRLRPEAVLGTLGAAAADIERQVGVALVLQLAESIGAIDRVFELTVEYLRDRWSFGRPLASYQALKHRVADMLVLLETAKGCADAAAEAVGTGSVTASHDVSVAKAYVGRVSIDMVSDCVQLHGGIAVTWEHNLHLFERRVALNRALYGTPEYHLERLCRLAATGSEAR